MKKRKDLYDADSIQSLSPLEHVRLRPNMYIGDTKDPTQLVVELFSNALDEHNLGHGDNIQVLVETKTGYCEVIDNGQGFPVNELREDGKTVLQASFDEMNTSGKYSEDGVYGGTSLGLNGVGGKASNFLSSKFTVTTYRDNLFEHLIFKDGVLQKREVGEMRGSSGTFISFVPDPQFFENPIPDVKLLRKMFHDICGMCPNLTIEFQVDTNREIIHHPEGIAYLVKEAAGEDLEIVNPLLFQERAGKYKIDCGLSYTSKSSATIVAYVNYGLTEQGPHITAIKSTITKVMNKWAREQSLLKEKEKNLDGDSLQEGLVLVFNLIAPNISYDAQTKSRVVNKDFVPFLNEVFSTQLELWLDNNPDNGKTIIEKAVLARRAAEAAKKAREAVKQKAAKKDKVFKMPTKLTDAWSKDRSKCELLIAEGLSAASGLVAARDSEFQAVYGIRGKALNVLKTAEKNIMKNQEINNIVVALGLDYNPNNGKMVYDPKKLRYGKIIACADADYDGYAIENLLFNIFWYLCPELIINGHIYSAVPPLFKVTTKKNEYIYLKDEKALTQYKTTHRNIATIGRMKGLGEMNSEELAECLLEPSNRTVLQLTVSDKQQTADLFDRLYGKAVEPRVKFILEHSEEARCD